MEYVYVCGVWNESTKAIQNITILYWGSANIMSLHIVCWRQMLQLCKYYEHVQKVKIKSGAGINSSAVQYEVVIVIVVIMLCV